MTNTFSTMYSRIASELNRSGFTADIKNAINDAILEGAKNRFYFNEVVALSFVTVAATEYYSDLNLIEVDAMYYLNGNARLDMVQENNLLIDKYALGTLSCGYPGSLSAFAHTAQQFRLYPIPQGTPVTIYVDGYSRLTPTPLVNDNDTNAWMVEGERYIRALAKSIFLRDRIRDYGEAAVYDGLAEDLRSELEQKTTLRSATGSLQGTRF